MLTTVIFSLMLIMGTLLSISSSMWLVIWMGLELNLMAMIPLLTTNSKSDTPMKYFMVQALASSMLLLGVLISSYPFLWFSPLFPQTIITLALLMKAGTAPLHFWFPSIMDNSSWMNCIILATWQKIAPLLILINMSYLSLLLPAMLSATIGAIGGFNQISIRKIMAYSSIGHLGWMLAIMLNDEKTFMLYLSMYILLSTTLMLYFSMNKLMFIPQILMSTKSKMSDSLLFLAMLSLGGLPPMLGFLPKWQIISLLSHTQILVSIILIMSSLITLYYYLQISYNSFMMSQTMVLFNPTSNNKLNMFILTPTIFGLPFMLLFL